MDVFATKTFDEISKEAKDIINLFNLPTDQFIVKSSPQLYGSFAQKVQPYFSDIDIVMNIKINLPYAPNLYIEKIGNKRIVRYNDYTPKTIFVNAFRAKILELSKTKDVFVADIKCGRYKTGKPIHWRVDEIIKTKVEPIISEKRYLNINPRQESIRNTSLDVKQTTETQAVKNKIHEKALEEKNSLLDRVTDDSVIKIDLIVPYEKRYIEATAIYHVEIKYDEKHVDMTKIDEIYENLLYSEFPEVAKNLLRDYKLPDVLFIDLHPAEAEEYYIEKGFTMEQAKIFDKWYDFAFYASPEIKYQKVMYNLRKNNLNFGFIGTQPIRDKDFYISRGFSNYEADQLIHMNAQALLANLRSNAVKYLHDNELFKMFKRIFSQLRVTKDSKLAEKIVPLFQASTAIINLQRVNIQVVKSLYEFRIIPAKDFVFNELDMIVKTLMEQKVLNDKMTVLFKKYRDNYKNEKVSIETLETLSEFLKEIVNSRVMGFMREKLGWKSIHDLKIHTDFINEKTARDFEKEREESVSKAVDVQKLKKRILTLESI